MNNGRLPIRVLIVEDHAFVRVSLRQLLEAQSDIEVIADTEFGEDAMRIVQEQVPHVVLLDLVLPTSRINGLEVLKRILVNSPATHVVVLSAYSDEGLAFPALRAGAIGYLLKNAYPGEVVEAVRDAVIGHYHLAPQLAKKIVEHLMTRRESVTPLPALSVLTSREQDVLECVSQGMSNAEIAERLTIAPATVKTHISNILHKLELKDRDDAALWWRQNSPPPA